MQSWKTRLVGQLITSFSMALIMSGIMGYIALGADVLPVWPASFLTAWPIAFVVSLVVGPFSFWAALKLAPAKAV